MIFYRITKKLNLFQNCNFGFTVIYIFMFSCYSEPSPSRSLAALQYQTWLKFLFSLLWCRMQTIFRQYAQIQIHLNLQHRLVGTRVCALSISEPNETKKYHLNCWSDVRMNVARPLSPQIQNTFLNCRYLLAVFIYIHSMHRICFIPIHCRKLNLDRERKNVQNLNIKLCRNREIRGRVQQRTRSIFFSFIDINFSC